MIIPYAELITAGLQFATEIARGVNSAPPELKAKRAEVEMVFLDWHLLVLRAATKALKELLEEEKP